MHIFIEIGIIISSLAFWFYIDTKKLFNNERIINSGLIHSVISGIGYNAGLICCPLIMYDYPVVRDSLPDRYLIVPFISFGYSFYDMYIGIKSKKLENVLHGFIMLSSFIFAYLNNITAILHISMVTETSSIFLNLRPFKQQWIDIAFLVTFFLYRLVLFPLIFISYVTNPNNTVRIVVFFESILLISLNVYWFNLIVKKALRYTFKKSYNEVKAK
jgi:hypothetical protein